MLTADRAQCLSIATDKLLYYFDSRMRHAVRMSYIGAKIRWGVFSSRLFLALVYIAPRA